MQVCVCLFVYVCVCVCVGPSSDGLSQALHSPDKCNFKDQDINVGVSIIVRGFNPCVRASKGCGAQVHKMGVCMHKHLHVSLGGSSP